MAAIEYGSYYWCVILIGNGRDAGAASESVHLHADEMAIDKTGALTFRSAGRRPTGAEPKQQNDKKEDGGEKYADTSEGQGNKDKENEKEKGGNMIYIAFAPGSWRVVYAAKLQDGSPASVEHWNAAATDKNSSFPAVVPPNSGASGYLPRE
jgi:hypothetical protein